MDAVQRQLHVIDKRCHERQHFYSDLFKKSPLLFAAVGLMGGIVFQDHFAIPLYYWITILILTAIAATATLGLGRATQKSVQALGYFSLAAFACLGAIRLITYSTPAGNDIRTLIGDEKTLASIRGNIVSEPLVEDRGEWEFADFVFTDPSTSFYLSVTEAKCIDGWQKAVGTIRMQAGEPAINLKIGDYIQADCWLDKFKSAQNPGQFDVKSYLARKNVYVAGFIKTHHAIEILNRPSTATWAGFLSNLKIKARQLLLGQTRIENDEQAMLAALLLGQRNTISANIITAFFKTGLIHILALSGGHVVALIGIVWWFSKKAGLGKRMRAAVCLFFIILFTAVVPPDASVLRASIIGAFFCISIIITRRPNSINTLALSAIILVLLRPLEFYEAGWQLSFACVMGILLLTGKIEDFIHRCTGDWFILDDEKAKWLSIIKRNGSILTTIFAAGIAATIGGAGILLYHFYTITPLTILWTILVTPVVSLILVVGFFKILFGVLMPTVSAAIGTLTMPLSQLFIRMVDTIARFDYSQMLIGSVPLALIIFYYAFVIFAAFIYLNNRRLKNAISLAAVLTIVGTLSYYKFGRIYQDQLEISCLSVGHGQAVVAKLPGNRNLIFDAGSMTMKDIGSRIVIPFLNFSGTNNIDSIFVSHYDIDHINGVTEIIEQRPVGHIYCDDDIWGGSKRMPKTAAFLNKCIENRGKTIETPPQDMAHINIIWPTAATPRATQNPNNLSQVILIEYAGRKILLCSDIEKEAQERILETYSDLRPDAIVLPHHGSENTISKTFVEKLSPSIVLCSCAQSQYERYHINPDDTKFLYTCRDGAIKIIIDKNGGMRIKNFCDKKK